MPYIRPDEPKAEWRYSIGWFYRYFLIHGTTQYGPIHFPVKVSDYGSIVDAVCDESSLRGIILCSDYTSEPISSREYERLMDD